MNVLVIQKKLMSEANPQDHCRSLFTSFIILIVADLYIFLLLTSFKNYHSQASKDDFYSFGTTNGAK